MTSNLIEPYCGNLTNAMTNGVADPTLKEEANELPSIDLNPRQVLWLELLLSGALSPLTGFMKQSEYESVLSGCSLPDGTFWSYPICLQIGKKSADVATVTEKVTLRDSEGIALAVLTIEDIWNRDFELEINAPEMPENGLLTDTSQSNPDDVVCLGGNLSGIQLPVHYDFRSLRITPKELRIRIERLGWRRVISYQTDLPLHKAQTSLIMETAGEQKASVLLQSSVDEEAIFKSSYFPRVRAQLAVVERFPRNTARLTLLPLPSHPNCVRTRWLRAIIAQNYGCSHLIIDQRHSSDSTAAETDAGSDIDIQGIDLSELKLPKISMIPYEDYVYAVDQNKFISKSSVRDDLRTVEIDETDLRSRLSEGRGIPEWYTFPIVAREMAIAYPPRYQQGFTVFFTGLSGAGKSTIANVLHVKLTEMGGRPVTLLDGDIVRRNLSSKLGFSKEDRNINIRRIGFVASEITKNGGIAICAPIAPYNESRRDVRKMISGFGGFILVHVATDLSICEERDRKGLYAKARAGIIKEFTGISDPYEIPDDADIEIDTAGMRPEEAAQEIIIHLEKQGYIDVIRNFNA